MERNDLDEFLNQAMMKEQDFSAQRANVVIVGGTTVVQVANKEIKEQLEYEHIRVPRRPKWDFTMSGDELQRLEREAFLAWRRDLAVYEEASVDKHATPFEKNIEVWKQLWRVVERSHVVAQIVDARNPLLYYCQDLFTLSKELDPRKACVLVINKSDFLTREARERWGKYFDSQGIQYIFWSALKETELQQSEEEERVERENARAERRAARREQKRQALVAEIRAKNALSKVEKTGVVTKKMAGLSLHKSAFAGLEEEDEDEEAEEEQEVEDDDDEEDIEIDEALISDDDDEEEANEQQQREAAAVDMAARDPYEVVGHQELLEFFRSFGHPGYIRETYEQNRDHRLQAQRHAEDHVKRGARVPEHHDIKDDGEKVIIGMLGFPNVGKSSTINALVGAKKVSVSSTAGHTKHFQTLNLGDGLVLCDCPGLVFPTFVHSKAALVINGVLPIDTLRDFISPVEAICQRISRSQIIQEYGLDIPAWKQLDAMTLLTSYARLRGYYKNAGRPDETRSARIMLKDYVAGKLLHCQCPPGLTDDERSSFYNSFAEENGAVASVPVPVPVNGTPVENNPLAFEEETGMMLNAGERSDVINVNVNRKKVVTVQPETEKLSVYENRNTKQERLKELENRPMSKKQLMRMRNALRKGQTADFGNVDITKKGSAGTNSSKFYGAVFENGKRVKQ